MRVIQLLLIDSSTYVDDNSKRSCACVIRLQHLDGICYRVSDSDAFDSHAEISIIPVLSKLTLCFAFLLAAQNETDLSTKMRREAKGEQGDGPYFSVFSFSVLLKFSADKQQFVDTKKSLGERRLTGPLRFVRPMSLEWKKKESP